ncbi:double-strand break repair protein AddB [Seohaeicola zhoushanensis]|uniref:Double-strand break repair protein AddB n=1 Tax=Seohaeicola zhoushanensis TaxID=1569283 RepID=A0A8J3GUG0_9RHOB|nr:double-strand break repair protein AddB [Seohaeicola zhoushanensis]GHF35276.1 double-strand break repair protein AddB [Seohaeicola zhoushanensis]
MFEPTDKPRVFALPSGADFPAELLAGLDARLAGQPPEAAARVHLIVNTQRMARRIRALQDAGPPRLLPLLSLITDLSALAPTMPVPEANSGLRRRLQLAQLVSLLLDRQPDLAARASIYDLADSLAGLMDEMAEEGVAPGTLHGLDVADMSGHWARALTFIGIAEGYAEADGALDPARVQRQAVEALIERWAVDPPRHPVVIAGSTGSRGTTLMLMEAVARLPQGAVILPGFDIDQPGTVWADLLRTSGAEDHPQYRFAHLMDRLDLTPGDIAGWTDTPPPAPARNRLVSLALRPAPFTDAWLDEGPRLGDLGAATGAMTLVEAPDPRSEALAIALRLREAAETGQTAALITPDRMLTRRVTAALDRWGIVPDDSAGMPLHLSPPGRFLRHVAALFCERLTAEALITLLKHPLCHSGPERNQHLVNSRNLELHLRRHGPAFPDGPSLAAYAHTLETPPAAWLDWLAAGFFTQPVSGELALTDWVARLRQLAELLAAGSSGPGSGGLWEQAAGREVLKTLTALETEAAHGGAMAARDFSDLLGALLQAGEEVRDRDKPHPGILIWGTLEARVQGAELLILGGLNDGSWPEVARPDPWLNRALRLQAGLLLPERRIGLSAHDFQQAIAAPEVWLTRAIRSDDAETVPSRWLNRLTNLLDGLPGTGKEALAGMRQRGKHWLDLAEAAEEAPRIEGARRPSPRPPVEARPRRLSITEIKTLIRDPYAIYARHVLRLNPLDPLAMEPDAALRGNVVHDILEAFIKEVRDDAGLLTAERLLDHCARVLESDVPWPAARRLWLARLRRIAGDFVAAEQGRQALARPEHLEIKVRVPLPGVDFMLTGRADRIDVDAEGNLLIYDYKTGHVPTAKEQKHFDKQLLIEAALAERGLFPEIPAAPVAAALFLGIGSSLSEQPAPLDEESATEVLAKLVLLIRQYHRAEQGFTARRMLFKDSDRGNYDHLARFGEWDASDEAAPEVLK